MERKTTIQLKEVDKEKAKISTGLVLGGSVFIIVYIGGAALILYGIYKLLDKHGGELLKSPLLLL